MQATQAVKIKFKIDKKSSSKIKFKNQFREIQILKTQVQIDRRKEENVHTYESFQIQTIYSLSAFLTRGGLVKAVTKNV